MLQIVSHPIVDDSVGVLRNKNSSIVEFRRAFQIITPVLLFEAMRDIPVRAVEIDAHRSKITGHRLSCDVVMVSILRAGTAHLLPALRLFPEARVGYFGLTRNRETSAICAYCQHLPAMSDAYVVVFDPGVASGRTLINALEEVEKRNALRVTVVCVIATREGVAEIHARFPNVKVFAATVDELVSDGSARPGAGDFGCRWHGTSEWDV